MIIKMLIFIDEKVQQYECDYTETEYKKFFKSITPDPHFDEKQVRINC